jgi:Uma2 family endonuclease
VEILSPYTRRRDWNQKRAFYLEDCKVGEYWVADPDDTSITRVRAGEEDTSARDALVWHPRGSSRALVVNVEKVFRYSRQTMPVRIRALRDHTARE